MIMIGETPYTMCAESNGYEELYHRVCSIKEVYLNLGIQMQSEVTESETLNLKNNVDLSKYDLYRMKPKVTYDDWCVCLYDADNRLYYINEDNIMPVKVCGLFEYDDRFQAMDENGKIIEEEQLIDHYSCTCCGEADDASCYVYFDM